jgi:hypothetical protein
MLWQQRKTFDLGLVRLVAIFACWGIGFAVIYLVQIRNYDPDPGWKDLWGNAFLRTSLFSGGGLRWLRDSLAHLGSNPVGIGPASIGCMFLIYGAARMARTNYIQLSCLLGPIAAVLLAAIVGHYPFSGRVILFTAPLVILLVSYGVQEQSKLNYEGTLFLSALAVALLKDRGTSFALIGISALVVYFWRNVLRKDWLVPPKTFAFVRTGLICALLLIVPFDAAGKHIRKGTSYINPLFHNYRLQELKPMMQHVRDNWREGDKIYLYSQTNVAFELYAERFGFKREDWTQGSLAYIPPTQDQIAREFVPFRGQKRVWLLFTHVVDRGEDTDTLRYTAHLDSIGDRIDEHHLGREYDAAAYLYDLSYPSHFVSVTK